MTASKMRSVLAAGICRDRPRPRHGQTVLTPEEAARRLRAAAAQGIASGLLFAMSAPGSAMTRWLLPIALLPVPTDPGFTSLIWSGGAAHRL